MNITLNGLTNPSNIITFSNTPTILTVEDTYGGSFANMEINFNDFSGISMGKEYYFTLNGHKITSTNKIEKAQGNRFYVTYASSTAKNTLIFIANKFAEALRNIGELSVNYDIYVAISKGQMKPGVMIKAKNYGAQYNFTVDTNLPTPNVISYSSTNGNVSSQLMNGTSNKIKIDVYNVGEYGNRINSDTSLTQSGSYKTTLEKEITDGSVSFDIGSLLSSFTENGKCYQYGLYIYSIVDAKYSVLKYFTRLFNVNGYLVNQGGSFIPQFTGLKLAQNVSRGAEKSQLNNTLLYVYEDNIMISLFADASVSTINAKIKYLDSIQNEVYTETSTLFASQNLNHFTIPLLKQYKDKSRYIDVEIPSLGTLRYEVIRPINATDECQRIYWYNSYGGVSFFDFTGDRTEERKVKTDFYQKSMYDYYKSDKVELNKVYDKNVEITVTLNTHNIKKDGQWSLFDLQNSQYAWTVVNGVTYVINVDNLKIEESTVTGIYTASVDYTYSLGDTF